MCNGLGEDFGVSNKHRWAVWLNALDNSPLYRKMHPFQKELFIEKTQ
jgi:hypothetical protein